MKTSSAAAIGVAVHLFAAGAATAQVLPEGLYKQSEFGLVEIKCNPGPTGAPFCLGAYADANADKPQGYLYLRATPGGQFTGHWAQDTSDQPCSRTNHFLHGSTDGWGRVEFQFDASGDSWTGKWGYCDADPTGDWNGRRGTAAANPAASGEEVLLCTGVSADRDVVMRATTENAVLKSIVLNIDAFGGGRRTHLMECDSEETCTVHLNDGKIKYQVAFFPEFRGAHSASLYEFRKVENGSTMKDATIYFDGCAHEN